MDNLINEVASKGFSLAKISKGKLYILMGDENVLAPIEKVKEAMESLNSLKLLNNTLVEKSKGLILFKTKSGLNLARVTFNKRTSTVSYLTKQKRFSSKIDDMIPKELINNHKREGTLDLSITELTRKIERAILATSPYQINKAMQNIEKLLIRANDRKWLLNTFIRKLIMNTKSTHVYEGDLKLPKVISDAIGRVDNYLAYIKRSINFVVAEAQYLALIYGKLIALGLCDEKNLFNELMDKYLKNKISVDHLVSLVTSVNDTKVFKQQLSLYLTNNRETLKDRGMKYCIGYSEFNKHLLRFVNSEIDTIDMELLDINSSSELKTFLMSMKSSLVKGR